MPIPLVHTDPCDFTMVDERGQIVMRGQTLDLPQRPGHRTFAEAAPPNTYRAGGAWVPMPVRPSPLHEFDWPSMSWIDRSLDQVRADKLAEINRAFSAASDALTAGYPVAERQTWAAQQSEALAWEADPATPTPYLDGIAAARGIEPADMRAKTLEAVNTFRSASQWLVGKRQALRDAINSPSATRAQIAAIAWPTSTPQE